MESPSRERCGTFSASKTSPRICHSPLRQYCHGEYFGNAMSFQPRTQAPSFVIHPSSAPGLQVTASHQPRYYSEHLQVLLKSQGWWLSRDCSRVHLAPSTRDAFWDGCLNSLGLLSCFPPCRHLLAGEWSERAAETLEYKFLAASANEDPAGQGGSGTQPI